ncbi:MAG: hypothetical protein ACI837_001074 [Crocinitomicaceae bacterium]|jgi:hypothetical protein
MDKIILLVLISLCSLNSFAQKEQKNSLNTSLIRFEKNSQTLRGNYNIKYITGIEYQRHVNNWSFGIKYEHGLNKINESSSSCYDCFYGEGYLREDNTYITTNYTILNLFDSKIELNTGLGLYYSNLSYSGDFQGGFSGSGTRMNSTYNTLGLTGSISIIYYPISRLFLSLNTGLRYGRSRGYNHTSNQFIYVNENVLTVPEFKIGVSF